MFESKKFEILMAVCLSSGNFFGNSKSSEFSVKIVASTNKTKGRLRDRLLDQFLFHRLFSVFFCMILSNFVLIQKQSLFELCVIFFVRPQQGPFVISFRPAGQAGVSVCSAVASRSSDVSSRTVLQTPL